MTLIQAMLGGWFLWLAASAAQPPVVLQSTAWVLGLEVEPASLQLSAGPGARVRLEVRDGVGTLLSGEPPELLARLGAVGPVREVGPGRYEAEYTAPATRHPQLEFLVARVPGRAVAFRALPLVGAGKVRVETEPGAEVCLEVAGRTFGPALADMDGMAGISFEAPPGVTLGELVTHTGARRSVALGVPQVEPLWLVAESSRLPLDDRARTRVHLFSVDPSGAPWSGPPFRLEAEAGSFDEVVELAPGHLRATYRAPPWRVGGDPGEQEVVLSAWMEDGQGPRAGLRLRLVPPPPPICPPPLEARLPAETPRRTASWAWASLGVGLAAVVPGAVLLGLDGRESCNAPAGVRCPEVYDTRVPGAVLTGLGGALLVAALVLSLVEDPGPGQAPDGDGAAGEGGNRTGGGLGLVPWRDGVWFGGVFAF
jgi:hypothetical protein